MLVFIRKFHLVYCYREINSSPLRKLCPLSFGNRNSKRYPWVRRSRESPPTEIVPIEDNCLEVPGSLWRSRATEECVQSRMAELKIAGKCNEDGKTTTNVPGANETSRYALTVPRPRRRRRKLDPFHPFITIAHRRPSSLV